MMRSKANDMTRRGTPVPVQCATCATTFTLTARAYGLRVARYGERLLCPHCMSDLWLRTRGSYLADRLLRDETVHAVE